MKLVVIDEQGKEIPWVKQENVSLVSAVLFVLDGKEVHRIPLSESVTLERWKFLLKSLTRFKLNMMKTFMTKEAEKQLSNIKESATKKL